jgi:hypothetical protein
MQRKAANEIKKIPMIVCVCLVFKKATIVIFLSEEPMVVFVLCVLLAINDLYSIRW